MGEPSITTAGRNVPDGVTGPMPPAAIEMYSEFGTPLIVTGADRQLLGQVCANMRALRPPDPYKNKGIRYAGERLRKKAGKTGASGGK